MLCTMPPPAEGARIPGRPVGPPPRVRTAWRERGALPASGVCQDGKRPRRRRQRPASPNADPRGVRRRAARGGLGQPSPGDGRPRPPRPRPGGAHARGGGRLRGDRRGHRRPAAHRVHGHRFGRSARRRRCARCATAYPKLGFRVRRAGAEASRALLAIDQIHFAIVRGDVRPTGVASVRLAADWLWLACAPGRAARDHPPAGLGRRPLPSRSSAIPRRRPRR